MSYIYAIKISNCNEMKNFAMSISNINVQLEL